jgi:hypothetical protein
MSRRLAAALLLIAVAPAGSAPRLKGDPGGAYFPTTVGDRWVIETRYPTSSEEYTEVVTAVERKEGATVVTVGREADGKVGPQLSVVRLTDDGLYRASFLGTVYESPYRILRLPLKPGESWTSEVVSGGTLTSIFKYKAVREEAVEVPAGKFRAFRIEVDIDGRGQRTHSTIWYDSRVGIVKLEHGDPENGYTRVLKSFKAGGK